MKLDFSIKQLKIIEKALNKASKILDKNHPDYYMTTSLMAEINLKVAIEELYGENK